MQTQDPQGLKWPENEAVVHHLSTVNTHGDLPPAIGNVQGDGANTDDKPRREHRRNKVKAETDDLRDQVARLRLEIRELRVEPQQGSARIWEMIGRFWWELRSLAEIHPRTNNSLKELQDQIQRSLDEIGPKQASYDEKEDDLIFLEYQLENKEIRLYELESRLERSSTTALGDLSSKSSSQQSRSTSPPLTKDESSLAHRYLSRVGDANIVNERLMELTEERAQYLDLERDRVAMGFQLYQPNVDFLARFDDVYANHLDQLREISEDIHNMELDKGLLSLDDVSIRLSAGEHLNPRIAPLRAQSDRLEGIVHDRIRRRNSDGDLVYLSFDRWSSRQSINRWISESLDISVIDGGRYHAIFDNSDLDEGSWWRLVQECWRTGRTAGLLQSSPGERSRFSASATSRDLRGQKPSLTFNDGPDEFENFSNYPVDPSSPDQNAAPDISWKSHAMANYFDMPVSFGSVFDDEVFSFHDGSEESLRL